MLSSHVVVDDVIYFTVKACVVKEINCKFLAVALGDL